MSNYFYSEPRAVGLAQYHGERYEQAPFNPELAYAECADALADLAEHLPEIEHQLEEAQRVGQELVHDHGILPSMFDTLAHSLFFAALVTRRVMLDKYRGSPDEDNIKSEDEFIFNAMMLLTHKHSMYSEEYTAEIYKKTEASSAVIRAEMMRLYNQEVTEDLAHAIGCGAISSAQVSLCITPYSEDPYDIMVLNVTANGMKEPLNPAELEPPGTEKEVADYQRWVRSLEQNANALAAVLRRGSLPDAFMLTDGEDKIIGLPLHVAQIILAPEEQLSSHYRPGDLADNALALLMHEYTHTQGGLCIDDSPHFGLSFEECRAESHSGNMGGYHDVKRWVEDIWIVSGVHLGDYINNSEKGGNTDELYTILAKRVGLQSMLEMALALPRHFAKKEFPINLAINEYLGGLDGVTERLHNRLVRVGDAEIIQDRIKLEASYWSESPVTKELFDIFRSRYDLSFVTDMVEAEYDARL